MMRAAAAHRTRRLAVAGVLTLALGGGLAACGGDDESDDLPAGLPETTQTVPEATTPVTPTTETQPSTETEPTTTEEATTGETVAVAADPSGQLAYVQKELKVKAGKVSFEFTNEAPVPHDFVIEQDGKAIARTEIISESKETLEADLEAGEYVFFCSVPGHRQAGMEGKLTAE